MDNIYEEIIEIIVAIAIIFLFPLIYFGQKQDSLIKTIATKESQEFVDEVRSKGYITKDMYDNYLDDLSKTGMLYEVNLEHRRHLHEPEYRFRTPEEVAEEQDNAYTGPNYYTYRPVTSNPPEVDDPVNDGNLNTETNESVLESSVPTPASPTHAHTDDCYHGVKHVHTGNATSGGGCYGSESTGYRTCFNNNFSITTLYQYQCSFCSYSYFAIYEHVDTGPHYHWSFEGPCPGTVSRTGTVEAYFQCTSCGYRQYMYKNGTYYLQPDLCGNRIYRTEYILDCGKEEGAYYNGNTKVNLICSQTVININPTHSVQTVAAGDPLITTVTAVYKDGSTKVVVATANTNTNTIVQNKTVTLTYTYILDGTSYSKQCTITITVIPRSKTCSKGHTYNLNSDGSDPGCPYCRNYLSNLQISAPASGSITIYKGTSLFDNGITLLATYMDGRTEYVTNGYIDNLDTNYVGTQTVTIGYKGRYVNLIVTTKRNLTLCSICGRYYELYPDGSNPGCPYCISLTPIFTGNVMDYYDENYADNILKELYEGNGVYYLSDRDYLQLRLYDLKKSWGGNLITFIFNNLGENNMRVIYGGYVREDGKY